jgi:hypothetical protein
MVKTRHTHSSGQSTPRARYENSRDSPRTPRQRYRVLGGAGAQCHVGDSTTQRHSNVVSKHGTPPLSYGRCTSPTFQDFMTACMGVGIGTLIGGIIYALVVWHGLPALSAAAADRQMTEASVKAIANLRRFSADFQWVCLPLLGFVIHVYANAIDERVSGYCLQWSAIAWHQIRVHMRIIGHRCIALHCISSY